MLTHVPPKTIYCVKVVSSCGVTKGNKNQASAIRIRESVVLDRTCF